MTLIVNPADKGKKKYDYASVGGCLTVLAFMPLLLVGLALLMAVPTMLLWNWLCPELFGLPVIGFWQALGLNILGSILFKGSCNHSCNK